MYNKRANISSRRSPCGFSPLFTQSVSLSLSLAFSVRFRLQSVLRVERRVSSSVGVPLCTSSTKNLVKKKLSSSLFFFPPVYFCRCRFRPKRATRADVHVCDTCECVTRACDPTCVRSSAPARTSKKWTLRVYIDNRSEMRARWSY